MSSGDREPVSTAPRTQHEILELLRETLEPHSTRGIRDALDKRGISRDLRTIGREAKNLSHDPSSGVRMKEIGRAEIYWYRPDQPFVDGLDDLNKLAYSGQFPLSDIIAKVNDVASATSVHFSPEEDTRRGIHRSRAILEKAKSEIYWWAGDFSAYTEVKDLFESHLKNNNSIRILMNINGFSVRNAQMVKDLCDMYPKAEVRHWESQWRGTIADRKAIWLVEKRPRTPVALLTRSDGHAGTESSYEYVGWQIDGSKQNLILWANWFCGVWDRHWAMSAVSPKASSIIEQILTR